MKIERRSVAGVGRINFFFVLVIKTLIMNLLLNMTGEMALLKAV
jgi:hypothetical protein